MPKLHEIELRGKLIPIRAENRPVMFRFESSPDIFYVPLFSTEEQLKAASALWDDAPVDTYRLLEARSFKDRLPKDVKLAIDPRVNPDGTVAYLQVVED